MTAPAFASCARGALRLDGRVVVVTGASSGLGDAYARALAEVGARLVLVARRRELVAALADELNACAVTGDVREPATADAVAVAALSSYGRIDVLVNNAGTVRDRTLLKMTDNEFDEVVRVHVHGSFYMARACAQVMRDSGSGGMIINVGSDSGLCGAFGQTNYAAAKGAVLGMTLTWARELERFAISCNCVLPNALTAMTAGLPDLLAEYRYGQSEDFPRALGAPAEAAPLVVLLASERWQHVTGRLLSLGGDRVSLWEPPAETRCAFLGGGWSVDQLDHSLEFALGSPGRLFRKPTETELFPTTKEQHGPSHPRPTDSAPQAAQGRLPLARRGCRRSDRAPGLHPDGPLLGHVALPGRVRRGDRRDDGGQPGLER